MEYLTFVEELKKQIQKINKKYIINHWLII